MQINPVLDAAHEHDVGVAVMNPLGGGIIAQNPDFFSFARATASESSVAAAMRFVKSRRAVKIVLSGVASIDEFDENLDALIGSSAEPNHARFKRVMKQVSELRGFCTNCNYCSGCPAGIPISKIMTRRNALLFETKESHNRTDPELVRNIKLFYSHTDANVWFPDTTENPCVQCGQCEAKCTQKLQIIDAIDDTFIRAEKVGFSLAARKERLAELTVSAFARRNRRTAS
jgi:predicted aldo/keto reductase-like oxidoreductase